MTARTPVCGRRPGPPVGYALTAWTTERGLPPGDVLVITQDLDGYLWLGTTSGLARFDGLQFSLWGTHGEPALPVRSVPALIGAHDGSLWIGFGNPGGVSRFRNGQIVHYSERDGLPRGAIAALIEDRHGTRLGGWRRRAVAIRGRSLGADGRRGRAAGRRGLHALRGSARRALGRRRRRRVSPRDHDVRTGGRQRARIPGASAKTEPARSG